MARFLIEIPHEAEIQACAAVVKVFLSSGSHLLTHADWGCMDGNHSAWLTVDVDSKEDALQLVPSAFRRKRASFPSINSQWNKSTRSWRSGTPTDSYRDQHLISHPGHQILQNKC